ncbi:Ig-like domain-containing protein [Roseateles sp. MS654]|uniref:Ig-like domain-containing protein n=1 Tax=Roseateles sp. MS654 TaxID=3412685 RepID=UPI003C2B7390
MQKLESKTASHTISLARSSDASMRKRRHDAEVAETATTDAAGTEPADEASVQHEAVVAPEAEAVPVSAGEAVGDAEGVAPPDARDEKSTEKSIAAMVTWLLGAALTAGSAVALSGGGSDGNVKPQGDPAEPPKPDTPNPDTSNPDTSKPGTPPKPIAPDLTLHSPDATRAGLLGARGEIRVGGVEAGARWEYSLDGGQSWLPGSGVELVSGALGPDGGKSLQVRQVSAAGVAGDAAVMDFVLDTLVETPGIALAADTGAAGDLLTKDATLTVSGLEAGGWWQYRINGGEWQRGTGASIDRSVFDGVADGMLQVDVRQIDAAGNRGETSSLQFELDRHVGAPIVGLAHDTGTDGDLITQTAELTVGGIEAGGRWQYRIDDGSWKDGIGDRITDEALNMIGRRRVEVRQIDRAGNDATTVFDYTIDRTPPAAPTVRLAQDTGVSASDRITKDARVTISGLESGATWQYSMDGVNWLTGTGNGLPASEFAGDGNKRVLVRQVSALGIPSDATTLDFVVDTRGETPVVALSNDTGAPGDTLTKDATLTVSGLEAGGWWQYRINGGEWQRGSGASIDKSAFDGVADGMQHVEVEQTDAAGNPGSSSLRFELDRHVGTPVVALLHDTGTDGDRVTQEAELTVGGIEAGAKWQYRIDGGGWKDGTGDRITDVALNVVGQRRVEVRQIDRAGNEATAVFDYTIDRTAPAAPTVRLTQDTGISDTDRITKDARVTISGLEPGATWQYSRDGVSWLTGTGNSLPASEFVGDGNKRVLVRQVNTVGIAGDATTLDFVLDTRGETPVVALANDTGASGDTLTKDATLTVSGLEAGGWWQYRINGGEWQRGSGASIDKSAFDGVADGMQRVEVEQTDAAGNPASSSLRFELDRHVGAPVVALIQDTGTDGDRVTQEAELTVGGIEAGAKWQYRIDGGAWKDGTGDRITDAALNVIGQRRVEVRQIDRAGNDATTVFDYTLDRTLPAAPTVRLTQDTGISDADRITKDARVTISGLEPGATWQYSRDGVSWLTGTGNSLPASEFVGDGNKRVLVRQTDAAGNTGASTELLFTVDTQIAAPGLTLGSPIRDYYAAWPGLSGTPGAQLYSNGGLNAEGRIDVSLETGSRWLYSLNGGQDWQEGSGTAFRASALKTQGLHELQVRQIDVAGNESAVQSIEFSYDTTGPAVTASVGNDGVLTFTTSERVYLQLVEYGRSVIDVDHWRFEAILSGQGYVLDPGTSRASGIQAGAYRIFAIDDAGNAIEVPVQTSDAAATVRPALVADTDSKWAWPHEVRGTAAAETFHASKDSDLFTGGAGADTFRWASSQHGTDFILDYRRSEGDVLDLSALTTGYTGADTKRYFEKTVLADGTIELWVDSQGGGSFGPGALNSSALKVLITALDGDGLLSVQTASGLVVL